MENKRSILITGTSSGIGKECALHLDKMGFKIFAGVRNEKDGLKLKNESSDRLEPIILDVTDKDTIRSAREMISQEKEYPLFALINNAGIGLRGVLEVTHEDELRKLLEVNVIGLHAVTREFLPLLRKIKGRIINIGSENCFRSGASGGSYAASKFAVLAITDSLRLELSSFDMFVSLIAPTSTHSDIWEKMRVYREKLHKEIELELREAYDFFLKSEERINVENIKPIPALEVAQSVMHAVTSKKPQHVYHVGEKAKKIYMFSKISKSIAINHTLRRLTKYMRRK